MPPIPSTRSTRYLPASTSPSCTAASLLPLPSPDALIDHPAYNEISREHEWLLRSISGPLVGHPRTLGSVALLGAALRARLRLRYSAQPCGLACGCVTRPSPAGSPAVALLGPALRARLRLRYSAQPCGLACGDAQRNALRISSACPSVAHDR